MFLISAVTISIAGALNLNCVMQIDTFILKDSVAIGNDIKFFESNRSYKSTANDISMKFCDFVLIKCTEKGATDRL